MAKGSGWLWTEVWLPLSPNLIIQKGQRCKSFKHRALPTFSWYSLWAGPYVLIMCLIRSRGLLLLGHHRSAHTSRVHTSCWIYSHSHLPHLNRDLSLFCFSFFFCRDLSVIASIAFSCLVIQNVVTLGTKALLQSAGIDLDKAANFMTERTTDRDWCPPFLPSQSGISTSGTLRL